ncbi:ParB N-terminal domain-containing protein [Actinocrinis puniceicyclus]|uniref:ParB N-terminal domain-containing protein n=1 Tax=Actinocrinis puniceicyclus TaxID=977794 RepID=A0A8J8BH20_9ACTN|nr:ParB N-terminal domain-containing protein [Actinocrinis puniceicyclus]MBS2966354.1 ParB N-terminal domain-containing protein [Actinocrinis puniceicyclus]
MKQWFEHAQSPPRPADAAALVAAEAAEAGCCGASAPVRRERDRPTAMVPVAVLVPGESPRLHGQDREHAARLAEVEGPLPPILVDRRTMQVIDGTHRLMAAELKGLTSIEVEFFDGSPADAFLRAVEANVAHGFPLSQADRRAAAERIVRSHPHLSDRAIAQTAGLAAKTVATIRRLTDDGAGTVRVGLDGRVRPLSNVAGRRQVAALMAERPDASLRELARTAGISPATVADVRRRLQRGEDPIPTQPSEPRPRPDWPAPPPAWLLEKLVRDPSLRQNENGRRLLRLLRMNALGAKELSELGPSTPPHCRQLVRQLAQQYAQVWSAFAQDL